MRLSEYDDEDLIEELKHRGIKIEVMGFIISPSIVTGVKIGNIEFDTIGVEFNTEKGKHI